MRLSPLLLATIAGITLGTATWHPWLWWFVLPGLLALLHVTATVRSLRCCGKFVFLALTLKAAGGAGVFGTFTPLMGWALPIRRYN